MTAKKAAKKPGRTTKKKAKPEIDKSKPWVLEADTLANLNRKGQKLFEKRVGIRFLHAVDALNNFGESMDVKNFDGELVDEYDVIVNIMAAGYESQGAEFDFTDEDEFGYGWMDLAALLGRGGTDPKG